MSAFTVKPIKFSRDLVCVPDKSITHRALMFGAIASGKSEVHNMLLGEDCLSTLSCMRALGADIELKGDSAYITGAEKLRSASLYAGNSGTTMRLLSGLLASREGEWTLSGDESLSRRPMNRVINPVTQMGGKIESNGGKAPLKITGAHTHGIDYTLPVASAQVKSAIILAALGAEGVTRIKEPNPTRDHTEIMLKSMGADIFSENGVVTVKCGSRIKGAKIDVAGDISSAAFPLVAGLISGGCVTVRGVGLNPTRAGITEIFDQIGADYSADNIREICGEKVGDITVRGLGKAKPYRIDAEMIPRLVDEIPVLAVLACFLSGDSVISGAEELRVKESDRITATLNLLQSFGGKAEEKPDGMIISGGGKLKGGCTFDPHGDHRMAMSAAVAAVASEKEATILNCECAAVSYPDFWSLFA